jgi:hypothetical protein
VMSSLMTLKPSDTSQGLHLGHVGRRDVHFADVGVANSKFGPHSA